MNTRAHTKKPAIPAGRGLTPDELLDHLPDACIVVSSSGDIVKATAEIEYLTGYSRTDLIGQKIEFLVPEELRKAHKLNRLSYARDPMDRPMAIALETELRRADGSTVPVEITLGVVEQDGETPFFVAVVRDVTEKQRLETERAREEQRFSLAFESNMAPMLLTDLQDRIFAANEAFCEMTGFAREELLGDDSSLFTHPEDFSMTDSTRARAWNGERQIAYVKRYVRKDGQIITVEIRRALALDSDGTALYHIISERDITEERELTQQLTDLALRDPLTGLANRLFLADRFEQVRVRTEREGGLCAVLLLDLDDFKAVNDSMGHLVGDELLVAVARRLEGLTRKTDTLTRLGGDEFLYLAADLTTQADVEIVVARLLSALETPFIVGGSTVTLTASLGAATCEEMLTDSVEMIRRADIALYEAKRGGRNQGVFYSPLLHEDVTTRFTIAQDLRRALDTDEIAMHYQPIVDQATGYVHGFEALMRWRHPLRGWIPPSVFIPVAEESDLINAVTHRALSESLATVARWEREFGDSAPYVSVNISDQGFRDLNFVDFISGMLATAGANPKLLVIELTERALLSSIGIAQVIIEQLGAMGTRVALDDFGTGYSSLSYLARLRPEIIKIDRSFIQPTHDDDYSDLLLEIIANIGKRLDLTLVAEGVETIEQRDRLIALGAQLAQGYLWSPAVAVDEARELLLKRFLVAKSPA